MANDSFVAFFVGIGVGLVLGIAISGILAAIRNSEAVRFPQVDNPTRLANIDNALEHYIMLRSHEPYGSEAYNRLTEDINRLRYERDCEVMKYDTRINN